MTLEARLTKAISDKGLTQAAVAEAAGTSQAAVSGWLSGKKRPTTAKLEALAPLLGVSASWLQFGKGTAPVLDEGPNRTAYTEALRWYFRQAPPDLGREMGNSASFAFDNTIATLVRETGQNTGDEKIETAKTVRLVYDVIELAGDELDHFLAAIRFNELEPHLDAAAEGDQKANAVIAAGLEALREDATLRLIRISDYNASGLTGPEYDTGRFMAVTRNTLDSQKDSDTAGGSFGLGKFTMWATSEFGLVITNSTLSEPEGDITDNRFFARLEIPWHEVEEAPFAGPAWLGEWDDARGCTRSYAGNGVLAEDVLVGREGSEPGTTFLIVGAFDPAGSADSVDDMANEMVEAAAENFWAAMTPRGTDAEPGLEVVVRTFRGRTKTSERIVDPADHVPALVAMLKKHYDDEVVEGLEQDGDTVRTQVSLTVPGRHGDGHDRFDHEVTLLVAQAEEPGDEDESPRELNRVAFLRGNNMTIRDTKIGGLPLGATPFHAIVLAGAAAGVSVENHDAERFLRAAEPPSHDRWTSTSELTTRYERGGKAAIDRFEMEVKDSIRELVKPGKSHVSDGPESLRQLLRLQGPTDTAKRPRIKTLNATRGKGGEWEVEASVSVPPKTGRWRFSPVLKFGTDSGASLPVRWTSLAAVADCEVEDDRVLRTDTKARTVRFRATSDPDSHPVASDRARVTVDLTGARPERGNS